MRLTGAALGPVAGAGSAALMVAVRWKSKTKKEIKKKRNTLGHVETNYNGAAPNSFSL